MQRRLIYPAVLRRHRGQNQKEQRVRRRVQSEIEEAVDQDRKASGQRAGYHAASKKIVSLSTGKAAAKQNQDKPQTQRGADDAAVRKRLQIIVVCLLETKRSVAGIVTRVDDAERTESRAGDGICLDHV